MCTWGIQIGTVYKNGDFIKKGGRGIPSVLFWDLASKGNLLAWSQNLLGRVRHSHTALIPIVTIWMPGNVDVEQANRSAAIIATPRP